MMPVQPTKYPGHKSKRELRCEEREEPGSGVERGADFIGLQVVVEFSMEIMEQSGQLIHLNLIGKKTKQTHEDETPELYWIKSPCREMNRKFVVSIFSLFRFF